MEDKEQDLSLNDSIDDREGNRNDHSDRYHDEQKDFEQNQNALLYQPKIPTLSHFYIHVTGQFESGEFEYHDGISIKFEFIAGNRWKVLEGLTTGLSQYGFKNRGSKKRIVWNYPFDITYACTSIKEWPQINIYCIGKDFLRRNVIQAYGCCHVPTQPGKHTRNIRLFTPLTSSVMTGFIGWLTGTNAEYKDPSNLLSKGEGREVTRVENGGLMTISFQITQRNLEKYGYMTTTVKAK